MKNIEMLESNYPTSNGNYNAFQCKLPLDIFTVVPVDDPVTSFVEIMKGIDTSRYFRGIHRGNKGYDPHMMLQVVLFAFMNGESELRKMEELCTYDIRYMWLSDEEKPSFMAFQRFISDRLAMSIEDIFYDVMRRIMDLDEINTSILYIDGTKMEANARKNSFVWKKAILGYQRKAFANIRGLIEELNEAYQLSYPSRPSYESSAIGEIADDLMRMMVEQGVVVAYGKGTRRSVVQRYYDQVLDFYVRLMRYEESLAICKERSSYSKTDHDATMMNMKYDYYNQTGVFKPGYNLQIGVSDGYIMHMGIFANPGDTKTYMPFMKAYRERYGYYPKWPIGDAGYGSYENLLFNVIHGMELGLKYNYHGKKNSPEFRKKIYNIRNWEEDERGYKICPEGYAFDQEKKEEWNDKGTYLQISRTFECGRCGQCAVREKCTRAEGQRRISINRELDELQNAVDMNLATEEGREMKRQRSIQAEGAFGVIKQDMHYVRIRRKGNVNVRTELFLVGIAYNIRKYHNRRMRKQANLIS